MESLRAYLFSALRHAAAWLAARRKTEGLPAEDPPARALNAAAMPGCDFHHQPSLMEAVRPSAPEFRKLHVRQGVTLLAVDARVKATQGNVKRAFEDISAILRMVRHLSGPFRLVWAREVVAWRTLEDVLRLAPAGKEALPPLDIPELPSLVRKVREEYALMGMIFPTAASQPSLLTDEIRREDGPLAAFVLEAVVVPVSRVFVLPDELAAMHRVFEGYRNAPRSAQDETPKDWADLRKSVETDPTSVYGLLYIRPKQQVLLADAWMLTALRHTARTGLALASYRRKHGDYPQRLEQLVPEFLPSVPVDPRDGQPLRLKRLAEVIVVYPTQDSAVVEGGKLRDTEHRFAPPIFRLYLSTPHEVR